MGDGEDDEDGWRRSVSMHARVFRIMMGANDVKLFLDDDCGESNCDENDEILGMKERDVSHSTHP